MFQDPRQFDDSVICAGNIAGESSCYGDSGGPLQMPFNINGRFEFYQIGSKQTIEFNIFTKLYLLNSSMNYQLKKLNAIPFFRFLLCILIHIVYGVPA